VPRGPHSGITTYLIATTNSGRRSTAPGAGGGGAVAQTSRAFFEQASGESETRALAWRKFPPREYPGIRPGPVAGQRQGLRRERRRERFAAAGDDGDRLDYLVKAMAACGSTPPPSGIALNRVSDEIRQGSLLGQFTREHDLPSTVQAGRTSCWRPRSGWPRWAAGVSGAPHQPADPAVDRGPGEMAGAASRCASTAARRRVGRAVQAFNDMAEQVAGEHRPPGHPAATTRAGSVAARPRTR